MASFKETSVIEKLNQSNYANWKFKMSMLLIKEDLNELIETDPPDPITVDWRKKDNKARALINLFINDDQIVHIREKRTAKETWETLKNTHERSNLSSKLFLLRKLYSTKLDEKGNMVKHITNILQIVDKLRAISEEINESHLTAILLCSVPQSYDTLITALEARPEPELTPEFVQNKLIDEYNKRVENMHYSDNSTKAFQMGKRPNYGQNRRENKFCSYCKMSNHSNLNCWHLKKQNTMNKNKTYNYKSSKYNKSSLVYDQENKSLNNVKQNERHINDEQITDKMHNMAFITSNFKNNTWIVDSGSSSHICNDENLFTEINDTTKSDVIIANGKSVTSHGSGNIKLIAKTTEGEINNITLQNVLYVPELQTNLLSVSKATQHGHTVIFKDNICQITHGGKSYIEAQINNNLYEVKFITNELNNYVNLTKSCNNKNCIELWHRRLGHRNYNSIKEIKQKNLATGINLNNCTHNTLCENCIKSKLASDPYPKTAQNRSTEILELIHSDLSGPMKTPTIGGKYYILTFIDDYSRFTFIYLISKKSEVLEKLKEYVASVTNKFGKKPQCLRSDNGGEYLSKETEKYLIDQGINHQLTVPNSPSQNGVAERKNRSLIEMTRTLLTEANLPHKFWGEAVNTANYIQNRLPTKANPCTPYERWTKKKPDLKNLRVFGCKAYTYIDKIKRSKLDNKAEIGTFVGYDNRSKGYRIYHNGKSITIARTVKFIENEFLYSTNESENSLIFEDNLIEDLENKQDSIEFEIEDEPDTNETQITDENKQQIRRSERHNKGVPPDRFIYLTHSNAIYEPKNWFDVINLNDQSEKENWLRAADEEINSLKENQTWILVDPPKGRKIIGSRWTFKTKYNSVGEIDKYKARLVAKGYSQKFGEDYDETYAPVVSHTTIRALLTKATHEKLIINHLDVKTAFLHGELDEDVYMKQPEGYIVPGEENKVCKLKKAIYGLKQAARAWHTKIANSLKLLGFQQCESEQCLFKKKIENDTIYLIVYVDDILIAGKQNRINKIIESLQKLYEIKNLGEIQYYLGIDIRKTPEGYYALNQKLKIDELVDKFNLKESKPCNTPIEPGYKNTSDNENLLPNNKLYRQAIGSLLYIATTYRPDISAAVNLLSRRNENPRKKDWEQVKHLIRYLKTTKDFELILGSESAPILTAYADADWGGDQTDRKSTSGNLFLVGETPIQWIAKKQSSVSLSSAEAEYISAANASQEILWLLRLLEDIDLPQNLPIRLFEDNQSTIKMINNAKYTNRTKHVDIKFHYIKDLHEKGIIDLMYCSTKLMTADILTKPLPKPDFVKHRRKLQLQPKTELNQDSEIEEECWK